jgi:serine/threonine protein kinase
LVIEAHLLSTLRHKNILKLRGVATDSVDAYRSGRHDAYFLAFDRLEESLDQRIDTWRTEQCDEPRSVMVERMRLETTGRDYSEPVKYAAQIASAISYMHERDIIYRRC